MPEVALQLALILQVAFCVAALVTLIFGFFLGTRYTPEDELMTRAIFVVGLAGCFIATVALCNGAPYIVGIGHLFGGFLMGTGMGMRARPRE
jgi:hypothetical protein